MSAIEDYYDEQAEVREYILKQKALEKELSKIIFKGAYLSLKEIKERITNENK